MQLNQNISETIEITDVENFNIVIISQFNQRHLRFAYRMQEVFGPKIKFWFQVENVAKTSNARKTNKGIIAKYLSRIGKFSPRRILNFLVSKKISTLYSKAEVSLHKLELERLEKVPKLKPIIVKGYSDRALLDRLEEVRPYFILVLGGPIIPNNVLNLARGFCINQHAGHSPEYKGSGTTEWAVFHRKPELIASTIHLMTSKVDGGAIIRRSNPTLTRFDNFATIFNKVVILGTELMIEIVQDITNNQPLQLFEQPENTGNTYRLKDLEKIKMGLLTDHIFGVFKRLL
jgi:folate-dependent phosphoribosylglycinamide formyltransferase PurN